MSVEKLIQELKKIADLDGDLLKAAEEIDARILQEVASLCAQAENLIQTLEGEQYKTALDGSSLDELSALATEFDASEDPWLQKQAENIDKLIIRAAEDTEALRDRYRAEQRDDVYSRAKIEKEKEIKVPEMTKSVKEAVKEYRAMEAPLSSRYCPDHAGASLMRVADGVYQCSLDKQVYNYKSGFSTMKGNKIPGGDVQNQTQALFNQTPEHMSFDTRENRLNK